MQQRPSRTPWETVITNPIKTGTFTTQTYQSEQTSTVTPAQYSKTQIQTQNPYPQVSNPFQSQNNQRTQDYEQQQTPQFSNDSGFIKDGPSHNGPQAKSSLLINPQNDQHSTEATNQYKRTTIPINPIFNSSSNNINSSIGYEQNPNIQVEYLSSLNDQQNSLHHSVSQSRPSTRREFEGIVVGERIGESRIISSKEGTRHVISTTPLESRITQERTVFGRSKVVSEVEMPRIRTSEKHQVQVHNVEVEIVKRDKIIEIIKEKPVKVERTVDVHYDVYIDVPIERTIEREKITNIVREIPIEKIVEVPINQIIETPFERIIERAVEVQKFVEVPYDRVINKPYDVIKENITFNDRYVDIDENDLGKYPKFQRVETQVDYQQVDKVIQKPRFVDNIIEQVRSIEHPRIIEVPREKLVERRQQVIIDRNIPVEKIIRREIEVPREREVYHDVEIKIERPKYVENIIERAFPVEKIVEREILVPVEHYVEKQVYVDNIIEKRVEHIVEIPIPYEEIIEEEIEQIIEVPFEIEEAKSKPTERIIKRSVGGVRRVEVPVEYPIDRLVQKSIISQIDRKVNNYTESIVQRTLERPVYIERVVEVPRIIDKVIEVEVEVVREVIKYVEKIIEKPVYIDTIIDKYVEVIVEKIVEVPVEKIIEIEVEIITEVPQVEEFVTYEDIIVEGNNDDYVQGPVEESREDFDDELLAEQIKLRQLELDSVARKNKDMNSELIKLQLEVQRFSAQLSTDEERENFALLTKLAELNSRYRMEVEHNKISRHARNQNCRVVDDVINMDPRVDKYRNQIQDLIKENQQLCGFIRKQSEGNLKQVRFSQYRS